MTTGCVAAVDLGATSGRVMIGQVGPDELSVEAVHRFPNQPVRTLDGLHWNILELYRNVLEGLRQAVAAEPGLISVGIASWAVDYGLVRGQSMIGNPFHYRDERTAAGVEAVHRVVDHDQLYRANGLQFQPFNTLYQLAVERDAGRLDDAGRRVAHPGSAELLADRREQWPSTPTPRPPGCSTSDRSMERGSDHRAGVPEVAAASAGRPLVVASAGCWIRWRPRSGRRPMSRWWPSDRTTPPRPWWPFR